MKFESVLLLLIGAAATGVVGWWFRQREARQAVHIKDLRSTIDSITDEVNEIEELSMGYFLKHGKDESVYLDGLKIKAKIQRVGSLVNTVHRELNTGANQRNFGFLTKLKNFRQAVTLDDFDSFEREAWSRQDLRFGKITKSAAELKDTLEAAYKAEKDR